MCAPKIDRQRAKFYDRLKSTYVDLCWEMLGSLPVDQMDSTMQERFLDTFRAFVPLHNDEVLLNVTKH